MFRIYAACAVWFFDRLIRLVRVLKNGVRRARVTEVGQSYVRVDIEGVRWGTEPGRHAYIYFPTLSPLRPWENHPFSLIPTSILSPAAPAAATATESHGSAESIWSEPEPDEPGPSDSEKAGDPEKGILSASTTRKNNNDNSNNNNENRSVNKTTGTAMGTTAAATEALQTIPRTRAGVTFFIRKSAGLTRRLRAHTALPVLLDGPYPNNRPGAVLRCDRVLIITGGIGITGVLPWAAASRQQANVRLCWSVRVGDGERLVEALRPALEAAVPAAEDREVRVGRRFDPRELIEAEVRAGWRRIGVVVCGPGGLCDDVRAAVAEIGRREASHGVVLELEVDAYSW